ncbi:GNAT family protein [Streptomyces sp. NPDC094032]|uniref:GNAT family N-acetyltransferase n=1 Tax=Streptomyces sp. NPDC094032 TaxID=3155308 RepID=UPI00331706F2
MTALEVPRLRADGLLLRPWEPADLPLVREASADPYIPLISTVPPVWSEAEGEAFLRRQWARAQSGAGYPFVITRTSDARPLGTIGLWLHDLPEGRANIGYWLSPTARGNGTATRALTTLTTWALTTLHVPRLQLLVEPWNTASARTAEHAGFVREGVLRGWQEIGGVRRDMVMYGRVAGDAEG